MGIFSSRQKRAYSKLKGYLKPKDGKVHVVMIYSNGSNSLLNNNFECEDEYTTQIDEILSLMQDDGYEIVDVKFNDSVLHQGVFVRQIMGFHTLVTYR